MSSGEGKPEAELSPLGKRKFSPCPIPRKAKRKTDRHQDSGRKEGGKESRAKVPIPLLRSLRQAVSKSSGTVFLPDQEESKGRKQRSEAGSGKSSPAGGHRYRRIGRRRGGRRCAGGRRRPKQRKAKPPAEWESEEEAGRRWWSERRPAGPEMVGQGR
ncbi:hypothetical protein AXG93_2396s1080 [Marchantia polymorpha subsp. ruderalis]|uniref:Uncharacterized protein n=1 Tax=Marchantia polymorpha subsp. ruderalis TaxID=1480154 RepID=A0A176VDW0_MARPO|nr:hypothetical protein AXG93_2396s1080 [Marchantia polymorpha subsp. ruderalis]